MLRRGVLLAALLALVASAPARAAQVVETTVDLRHALTAMPPQPFLSTRARGAMVVHVNDRIRYQKITGFGAAMTDTSAWLLYDELSPRARATAMQALFGRRGIHLNFVHIPMGATDYTITPRAYSYDDLPPGQTDPTLAHFSIAHDAAYIIPALRAALAINRHLFTLANPWSPPPWMKANGAFNNIDQSGSVLPQDYPALALYFVKFIQAYQAAGVPIDAITPMNEPRANSGWPGAALSADNDATFVPQYLSPALAAAGLHPTIFGLDDTELSDAQALLSGPAGPDLGGIAFHCYQGLGQMSTLHAEYPDRKIIVSECSPGIMPYATGELGIDATANWAGAVQLWNLALDPARGPYDGPPGRGRCTALVTVDERTHHARLNLNYYQYGQLSKYVERGARRIYATRRVTDGKGISRGLDDVAFENPDGSKVLVAYNDARGPERFAIEWRGRYLTYRLPAAATATFIWR